MWYVWLIVAGVCFIVEIVTVGFFVFWFGIGALISMLVSLFLPDNILLQAIIFLVSSVILLFLTKPLVDRFTRKDIKTQTNAYSIIGKKGLVIQDINNILGSGQIKIANEVWSAKTENETIIKKGLEVNIIRIDGVKAVVEPTYVNSEITK